MTTVQDGLDSARLSIASASTSPLTERLLDFTVHVNDAQNYHILLKDIFSKRIYHFETANPRPVILDCGANIGMSVLYFKHVYPEARVVAFEPDPVVADFLTKNIETNGLEDVKIVRAALSDTPEPQTLFADGRYASTLEAHATPATAVGSATTVPCVRLFDYLEGPVDFLKMNIEGAEWNVLRDAEGRLDQISSMVIEYHHLPGLPRTLHEILALLDRCGFDYLIHDFDDETNPHVRPPFRLTSRTSYYLLIYAQRRTRSD